MSKDNELVSRFRRTLLEGLATAAGLASCIGLFAGIGYLNHEYQYAVAPYARAAGLAVGLFATAFVVITRADFLAVFAPGTARPKLVILGTAIAILIGSQILVFWLLELLFLLKDSSTPFLSRSPVVVAAYLIGAGVVLSVIRSVIRFSYGLAEAATGVVVGYNAAAAHGHIGARVAGVAEALELGKGLFSWAIVTSSLFLIVRGLENAWLGVRQEKRSLEVCMILRLIRRDKPQPTDRLESVIMTLDDSVALVVGERIDALERRATVSETISTANPLREDATIAAIETAPSDSSRER